MRYESIVLFAFILHSNAFFFTENITEYNKLADLDVLLRQPTIANKITPQPSPSSSASPTIVTLASIFPVTPSIEVVTTNTSIDNSILSKNETQPQQGDNITIEKTIVDSSEAMYERALMIAPRVTGKHYVKRICFVCPKRTCLDIGYSIIARLKSNSKINFNLSPS